ncbi:GNAT family N-acetyltransferase [Promicromonospora sp. Marseille-Q5078]
MTPLTAALVELDHEAYTASPDVIRLHSAGRWRAEGFTLGEDLELVAAHAKDHESGRAFTFALLDPRRSRAVGCLYVRPLDGPLPGAAGDRGGSAPSAMVTFWVRQDEQTTGLVDEVVRAVQDWLRTAWPLAAHVFRVLPAEVASCAALDRLGLERVQIGPRYEDRPYRWYLSTDGPILA